MRPFGPLAAPQNSGVFYLIALVYALALPRTRFWWVMATLLVLGMVLTMSRTAIGTFILIVTFEGVLSLRRRGGVMATLLKVFAVVTFITGAVGLYYVISNVGVRGYGLTWTRVTQIF